MSLSEDKIALIHKRAEKIREERDRRLMRIEACVSTLLGLVLVLLIAFLGRNGNPGQGDTVGTGYAGASIMESSAGAYVLVALAAFFFGVMLTILIRNYMDKHKDDKNEE